MVILVGISQYFLGIYHTNTEVNIGWYILVLFFWREPLFFLERGVMAPLFEGPSPLFEEKRFPLKPERVPAKFFSAQNTDQNTNLADNLDTG